MNKTRKPRTPRKTKKEEAIPGASAPARRGKSSVFDIIEAATTADMMSLNGPKVLQWALKCVQKAAQGRANPFEQKIALLLIHKVTPSTGKRKDEDEKDVPEGTTKEEYAILNRLIEEGRQDYTPPPADQGGKGRVVARDESSYKVREAGPG